MNRREAKRRVAAGAHRLLSSAYDQEWLYEGYSPADAARMEAAFNDLLDELAKRAGETIVGRPWQADAGQGEVA